MVLVVRLVSSHEQQHHLELDKVVSRPQSVGQAKAEWRWRSQATNLKTLYIVDPGQDRHFTINIRLCISPASPSKSVDVQVTNIRYSNDGSSDMLYVQIDGRQVGTRLTYAKSSWGHGWNVFRDTMKIGDPFSLSKGEHILSLQAKTDRWGVEFDRIVINSENQNEHLDLICGWELSKSTM